eukprot:gb/GEZJ01006829.1/.p2 GENE.gb/GEZJ01006829.1/~~gb/GEZJ01006829.1/.p2  ORF type:complete len:102 (-),score=7.50 gb/GEZJ01006829.1/:903-1208(-)
MARNVRVNLRLVIKECTSWNYRYPGTEFYYGTLVSHALLDAETLRKSFMVQRYVLEAASRACRSRKRIKPKALGNGFYSAWDAETFLTSSIESWCGEGAPA